MRERKEKLRKKTEFELKYAFVYIKPYFWQALIWVVSMEPLCMRTIIWKLDMQCRTPPSP